MCATTGFAFHCAFSFLGDRLHAGLIAAAVADQDDVLEAVHLQAVHDVGEHRLNVSSRMLIVPTVIMCELLGSIDPSGTSGMIGAHSAFPSLRAMAIAVRRQHVVVLAERQPWPVRLDAAGRDDDRRLAGLHGIANVHPRHLFEPDRIGRPQRIRACRRSCTGSRRTDRRRRCVESVGCPRPPRP
jgi:hypothetical protein